MKDFSRHSGQLDAARKSYHIITFGCQMNDRDSQWLASSLAGRGFVETDAAEARVIILNTCSVREKPERKVVEALRRLAAQAPQDSFFCVLGCVAQQLGEKLFSVPANVRLVAGSDALVGVPEAIVNLLANPKERLALLEFGREYPERPYDKQTERQIFVNIMQGCDNFCSYCIVPFTRGRQKSRKRANILEECRRRLESGSVEITLLGQNVNAWGKDLGERGFASLLEDVAALPGLKRLRFVTPHPADMDEATVRCFAEIPSLCPRLHLPLQAGSDRILRAMRRRYTSGEYLGLVERLRFARPDIALTADLIVGFPGEGEEDFQATLELVRRCAFMSSYSFRYSDRPGARASLFPDKIPLAESGARLTRLQELQEELTAQWLAARVGEKAEILLEGPSRSGENSWQGRDVYGALIHVELSGASAGDFLHVRITGAKKHTLAAIPCDCGKNQ